MKKVFTLFAAALLGFCAFAQDEVCPTVPEFYLLNGEDAANVELELGLKQNASANLNGFNFEVQKPAAATWKRAQGLNYFSAKGYAPYILGCLAENMGMEFSDAELEEMLGDLCDVKSSIKEEKLVIIEVLSTLDCRFFPEGPGKVGKFKIDMSALEDGEYELKCDATPQGGSFSFTGGPEGNRAWTINEPLVITLVKENNVVTVKGETPVVEPITITGIVTDNNDAPLEGVTVTLDEVAAKEAITTTTGADGAYSLTYTPEENKEYNVTFAKDNYQPAIYPADEVPEVVKLQSVDTGISTIGVDGNNGRIYDLQGRELKSVPEHGIYIQNGKKYVK